MAGQLQYWSSVAGFDNGSIQISIGSLLVDFSMSGLLYGRQSVAQFSSLEVVKEARCSETTVHYNPSPYQALLPAAGREQVLPTSPEIQK